ncbi:L-cysteine S-thiosulfotransferase [Gammaproteobacteria bacterium]
MKITKIYQLCGMVVCAAGISLSVNAQDGSTTAAMNSAIRASFRAEGIVSLDSINQDATQALCSDPKLATGDAGAKQRAAVEKENHATIKSPGDGQYLGDWKEGDKIAENGKGSTWTDKAGVPNGGACYNCHQIGKDEISYGTIGPSLYNYRKSHGDSQSVVEYTWGKIYNAKAYNACSAMPRFGHFNLLTEKQIKDLVALLLDPASPANQ